MNIIIKRENILTPLQNVIGAIERKQTLPILGNVLLQSRDGGTTLTATDLEIELIAKLDFATDVDFSSTIPARKLFDICKSLPDGCDINFLFAENKVTLTSGRTRFTLSTLPPNDFPEMEEIDSTLLFEIPQKSLKLLFDNTSFAMALQDVRYYLNGMLVELDNNVLRMVATDGHRLALGEYQENLNFENKQQLIIPRKGLLEMARLLSTSDENACVKISHNHIRIETEALIFTSKLIDGKFPDYNRVIPVNSDKTLTVNREQLKNSLHRTSILSNEKYRGIRFKLEENNLTIQANNPNQEEAQEELTVDFDKEKIEIGFNVTYLLDVLTVIDSEEVDIMLSDSNSSCIVKAANNENFRYVVMPMRL